MEGILITSVLSSVGLGVSSFFGFFLLRNKKLENRLLAWLLIALSLRIAKSIFYIHLQLPLIVKNLGLAANLAVGPLLYLYVRSLIQQKTVKGRDFAHFIPTGFYVMFSPILPNGGDSQIWVLSYAFILIQSFVYVYISASLLAGKLKEQRSKDITWLAALIACLAFMWAVYALIFLKVIPVYALGPVSFSITIFILLYLALNHHQLFVDRKKPKYIHVRMSEEQGKAYFDTLKHLVDSDQLYKKGDISLSLLATKMGLLERDVSYIINRYGDSNFAQFINGYRIEEAKRLIDQDASKKMISIALEAGFNNLGTFNKVFKSFTDMTPSEFKKR
ncbi:MAG: helix-turn-helix domain-containing protein [Bacteroidota bacterium]